jgi:drug/metabolite transporter (DMT)-like permease
MRRELASRRRVVALVVALGGVSLVLAGGIGGAIDPIGIALALAAAVAYAAYVLVSDRLLGTTGPLVLAAMLCSGAATAFGLGGTATRTLETLQPSALLVVLAIAVVATVLPIVAFLAGVRRIGPSRGTILGTIEPPVTIALSALVFGERLGAVQFAGAGLVLSAVLILQLRRRPALRPVPQPAPTPAPTPLPDTERIAA